MGEGTTRAAETRVRLRLRVHRNAREQNDAKNKGREDERSQTERRGVEEVRETLHMAGHGAIPVLPQTR